MHAFVYLNKMLTQDGENGQKNTGRNPECEYQLKGNVYYVARNKYLLQKWEISMYKTK